MQERARERDSWCVTLCYLSVCVNQSVNNVKVLLFKFGSYFVTRVDKAGHCYPSSDSCQAFIEWIWCWVKPFHNTANVRQEPHVVFFSFTRISFVSLVNGSEPFLVEGQCHFVYSVKFFFFQYMCECVCVCVWMCVCIYQLLFFYHELVINGPVVILRKL